MRTPETRPEDLVPQVLVEPSRRREKILQLTHGAVRPKLLEQALQQGPLVVMRELSGSPIETEHPALRKIRQGRIFKLDAVPAKPKALDAAELVPSSLAGIHPGELRLGEIGEMAAG